MSSNNTPYIVIIVISILSEPNTYLEILRLRFLYAISIFLMRATCVTQLILIYLIVLTIFGNVHKLRRSCTAFCFFLSLVTSEVRSFSPVYIYIFFSEFLEVSLSPRPLAQFRYAYKTRGEIVALVIYSSTNLLTCLLHGAESFFRS